MTNDQLYTLARMGAFLLGVKALRYLIKLVRRKYLETR